jgi:hypothetical protein
LGGKWVATTRLGAAMAAAGLVASGLVASGAMLGSLPAGAAGPVISAVAFTGNSASNTITVTGTGFGSNPPSGEDDDVTSCGTYTDNGKVYANMLYFEGATFEAGSGFPDEGDCVGIIVERWSDTQAVLQFGNAYNTFGGWNIQSGQSFTLHLKGTTFTGSVSFNGSSSTTPCTGGAGCTVVAGSPVESVAASGTSSTSGSMTISQTTGVLNCGPGYNNSAPINKLSESNFTSTKPITVVDVLHGFPSAKGLKVCFQPLGANPPAPTFLAACPKKPVPPCATSIKEVSGDAVATLLVPANDPRFWLTGGIPSMSSFKPASGKVGTKVTIKGKNLSEATSVRFGSTSAAIGKRKPTALTVTVPTGASTAPITVVTPDGTVVSSTPFTVTS